jgi:DNA-binding GntR family transcriptional regulator
MMVDEHTAIVVAIAAQNADAAQEAATTHVRRAATLRLINRRWRESGGDGR